MLDSIWRAVGAFGDKGKWAKITTADMTYQSGWDISAEKYLALYQKLL